MNIEDNIQYLIDKADTFTEKGDYMTALEYLKKEIALVPKPFNDHPKSMELIAAIGDNYFFMGQIENAQKAFSDVMCCGDAPANPYIRLRRG